MIQTVSPNKLLASFVGMIVFYYVLSIFVDPIDLRDTFNSLQFGVSLVVVLTWFRGTVKAVRDNSSDGAWILVLAIFSLNFTAFGSRIYAMLYNWYGRPDAWAESAIPGFIAYCYMICCGMFLVSPGVKGDGVRPRAWWALLAAGTIGGVAAGILIGLSISTVV